jgi:malate synthase
MRSFTNRAGLKIDEDLAQFVEQQVLAPLGRETSAFWAGFATLVTRFAPQNRALLARRDALQAAIDVWHKTNAYVPAAYQAFLQDIGYIAPEPAPFSITTQNVDPEIATMAGPQLVVPMLNARFLLNAANARWGSLYDAL